MIGSGPWTTLAGDANADIMRTIIDCARERVRRDARTVIGKVKAHREENVRLLYWGQTLVRGACTCQLAKEKRKKSERARERENKNL